MSTRETNKTCVILIPQGPGQACEVGPYDLHKVQQG